MSTLLKVMAAIDWKSTAEIFGWPRERIAGLAQTVVEIQATVVYVKPDAIEMTALDGALHWLVYRDETLPPKTLPGIRALV